MTTENIIDGRHRFSGRNLDSARGRSSAELEQRLAATARVPDHDKPILASNLGKLASKVQPENPLVGARTMIEQAGLEGLWQKRKRFIRLPDESNPRASSAGEYGSSGATFVQLARAAAQLLAGNHSVENADSERANAIRALASGSSFLPNYTPRSGAEKSAKGLLDEYRNVLSTAIAERTSIRELWAVLRDAPFDVTALDEEEFDLCDVHAASPQWVPAALMRPMFSEFVEGAVFDPDAAFPTGWQHPMIEIGQIAFRTDAPLFVLPTDVAEFFKPEAADADGVIPPEARAWLQEQGAGQRHTNGLMESLPQVEYGERGEFGWRTASIACMKHAGLEVCPSSEGEPTIRLVTWGLADTVAYTQFHFSQREEEAAIAASAGTLSQVSMADIDGSEIVWVLHAAPFEARAPKDPSPRVVGLLDFLWHEDIHLYELLEPGWTETPSAASLLLKGEHQFYPAVPQTEAPPVPIQKGSVGAGLYANLVAAVEENRFDKILIEKAKLTAEAGLRFHEWMVEHSRDALKRI